MARTATTADVFNAVAEERRRDILDELHGGEAAVGDLAERLHLEQPQVSKHLKVLREVDLVRCRTVGRRRLYRVNGPALRPLRDWVRRYEALVNAHYDRDVDGNELGWHETYREIEQPHRIVSTEVFEGFPDAESVNTMTLVDDGGVTILRTLVRHATREFRDGHIASGMEKGMQVTFDRLDDLLAASDAPSERFRRVAGRFSDRVREVPAAAWDNPSPCEGWTARDVVRHLVEWMPGFLTAAEVTIAPGPSVDADPAGAWEHLAESIQALLDDSEVAAREFDAGPPGRMTVENAVSMLFVGDIVIHTWDLARATGLDESLDPVIAAEMLAGMEPLDEMLRQSGHYGPSVTVPDDADDQTKLIAFVGRTP